MRIVIAGSSGLIGSALIASLDADGHEVVRLVRPGGVARGRTWDPRAGTLDAGVFDGAEAVVNLAGRSIGARRWSEGEKHLLWESRVTSTRLIAERLAARSSGRPRVLINASAVGIYGDGGDRVLTDDDPPGTGFFPDLCRAWEEATRPAAEAGVRVVNLRNGIILSAAGGVVGRLLAPLGPRWLSPYRWGLGGPVAGGRQYWSWLSLDDETRAIRHLLDSELSGPINVGTPQPATNREFTKALGRALHRPEIIPIPGLVVKLMLGSELATSTVLEGQRAVPARLEADGFEFGDTDLEATLVAALGG